MKKMFTTTPPQLREEPLSGEVNIHSGSDQNLSETQHLNNLIDTVSSAISELASFVSETEYSKVAIENIAKAEKRLRRLEEQMGFARGVLLPRLEADGIWKREGGQTFHKWLALHDDVPAFVTKRETSEAATLDQHLHYSQAAGLAGVMSKAHISSIIKVCTTESRITALTEPQTRVDAEGNQVAWSREQEIISGAKEWTLKGINATTRLLARMADPDADERGYVQAFERQYFDLRNSTSGVHVKGFLTHEAAETLNTAIEAIVGVPAAEDQRTPTQRRAQAIADLGTLVMQKGLVGSGCASVRPHLTVHVNWKDFQTQLSQINHHSTVENGTSASLIASGMSGSAQDALFSADLAWNPADADNYERDGQAAVAAQAQAQELASQIEALRELDLTPEIHKNSTGPIPTAVLAKLACDSAITRVIFGPDSQVLNVGREKRLVSGQLRKAVLARDGGCRYPGCDQPPDRCEIHHPHHWAKGGATSSDNSITLCWHHHQHVHNQGITITARPTSPQTDQPHTDQPHSSREHWIFHDKFGEQISAPVSSWDQSKWSQTDSDEAGSVLCGDGYRDIDAEANPLPAAWQNALQLFRTKYSEYPNESFAA